MNPQFYFQVKGLFYNDFLILFLITFTLDDLISGSGLVWGVGTNRLVIKCDRWTDPESDTTGACLIEYRVSRLNLE